MKLIKYNKHGINNQIVAIFTRTRSYKVNNEDVLRGY